MVHRLVAQAFIPNPENKPFVNHIDSNRSNNHISNLEWVTNRENFEHAVNFGSMERKLSQEDLDYIRENYKFGSREFGAVALGKKFGMNNTTILRAVKGITYSHM